MPRIRPRYRRPRRAPSAVFPRRHVYTAPPNPKPGDLLKIPWEKPWRIIEVRDNGTVVCIDDCHRYRFLRPAPTDGRAPAPPCEE